MRPAREIMGELALSGLTPDQTALMLELMAAVAIDARPTVDVQAERRREKDRQRKRDAVPQTPQNSAETAESPAPSPSSSPDPSNNPTPTPGSSPRARKGSTSDAGHRLPRDWQPAPLNGEVGAAIAKWPPGALDRELAKFRDWAASATGPSAKKSDWQAAYRNWLRRAEDEGRYPHEQVRSHRGSAPRAGDGFGNALREMSGYPPPHH